MSTNNALAPEQVEELRLLLQPVVVQWQIAQALVVGYLAGAEIESPKFSIDLNTGIVTLAAPPVPDEGP